MPNLTVNGAALPLRLVEDERSKLRLDPGNLRLHSAYLTRKLPAEPTQKQIEAALSSLPDSKSLTDALIHNEGCFTALVNSRRGCDKMLGF